MNEELLLLLNEYFKKYYKKTTENNPFKEFKKFYLEYPTYYIDNNPIAEIAKIIDMRLLSRKKIETKYDDNYPYVNNVKGVNTLKRIYRKIKEIPHTYNMYDLERKLDLFNYYQFLLYLILTSSYPIIRINDLDKYIYLLEHNYKNENNNEPRQFFRGQSDVKWNIIPSCLRNLNLDKTQIFKYEDLINKYKSINVYDIYANIIDQKKETYPMVSFIQHSISYSPLVDFTSHLEIATFFALHNYSNINDFFNKDSAVFVLDILKNKSGTKNLGNQELKDLKIGIYKDGRRTYSDYVYMYENMKRLFGTNATTFFSAEKTNDRMKYQAGAFIYFNDFIIDNISSTIITSRNGCLITKFVIDKSIKKDVLNYLNSHYSNYKLRYLMNPYLRFEESF